MVKLIVEAAIVVAAFVAGLLVGKKNPKVADEAAKVVDKAK